MLSRRLHPLAIALLLTLPATTAGATGKAGSTRSSKRKEVAPAKGRHAIAGNQIKISKLSIDGLLKIAHRQKSGERRISLPSPTSPDVMTRIDFDQAWGRRNLKEWKDEFVRVWGDQRLTIDFAKPWFSVATVKNRKYQRAMAERTKAMAKAYNDQPGHWRGD